MEFLYKKLDVYHGRDIYPFHMPGHKRNERAVDFLPGLTKDITEIEGFDQLHHPTGVLRRAQDAAARLYGADETFYSVNGSTGALLAAVSACTTCGGALLMARNCHQSVYHGVCLRHLESYYLYPQITIPYGLNGSIQPGQVEEALNAHPDVQAVLITSPTYDGIVSPIKEIAEVCHRHGRPLIVDEAHGAHLFFHDYFPETALHQGADVVIHSLHKTLPSLTQTALLHVKGDLADRVRIRRFMAIFQSSSPSYLLMGSMDACIQRLAASGRDLFDRYVERLEGVRQSLSGLSFVRLAGDELIDKKTVWDMDRSKLILDVNSSGMNGHQLYKWLWKERRLQMEMAAETYVLGMTSVADTEEGYLRLCHALEDLERTWEKEGRTPSGEDPSSGPGSFDLLYPEKVLSIGRAMEQTTVSVPLDQSAGCIAGGFLSLYPPGIPLAVPGERISTALIDMIRRCIHMGLNVHGLEIPEFSELSGIPVIPSCH